MSDKIQNIQKEADKNLTRFLTSADALVRAFVLVRALAFVGGEFRITANKRPQMIYTVLTDR